ncbi:unnamed protein product, partial [Polarella glacialis]
AEWSQATSQASSLEVREERRLFAARRELEELGAEAAQQGATFRQDRDRLRQRLRNLRMQLRQAERQSVEAVREEAFSKGFCEVIKGPADGKVIAGSTVACSSTAPAPHSSGAGGRTRRLSGSQSPGRPGQIRPVSVAGSSAAFSTAASSLQQPQGSLL